VIKHYAGPVTYTVHGFMDKNNNNLYRNLKELMLTSQNSIVKEIYFPTELNENKKSDTVGVSSSTSTSFK
jgi:myosin-1